MKTCPPLHGRSLLCGAVVLTLFQTSPACAQIQVDVNRREVDFGNVAPVRIGGRVFIPLRAVAEALGADVRWTSATQTVHGSKGSREFALPLGSHTAQANGRTLELDAPARLISGTTMVPLRFVAEALGADVVWNDAEQKVAINLGEEGGEPSAPDSSVSGELVSVEAGANPRSLVVLVDGARKTYRIGDETRVTREQRGGASSQQISVDQLRPGDQVSVRLDPSGRYAEQIDSTRSRGRVNERTVRGEVIRMMPGVRPPLMVVMVDGARKTYEVTGAIVSRRSGRGTPQRTATLKDVLKGDQVVIQVDRTGQIAQRIDATQAGSR